MLSKGRNFIVQMLESRTHQSISYVSCYLLSFEAEVIKLIFKNVFFPLEIGSD